MTSNEKIIIEQMELGPMQNFVYFIGDPSTKKVAVVDPAWDIDALCRIAKEHGHTITSALLTHGHPDHMQGLEKLLKIHDVPVYLSEFEPDYYTPACPNLVRTCPDQIITVGQKQIRCLHTPGHTPGSQCFLMDSVLLTGDTLFIRGCGRCDLPGGDAAALYNSLFEVIRSLPETTMIYPGHRYGPAPFMTLKELLDTNPSLQFHSRQEFVNDMTGGM